MNTNPTLNYEYEQRAMLNEEQYLALMKFFSQDEFKKQSLINSNYYFDTSTYFFNRKGILFRLRIIEKNGVFDCEFTIKESKNDSNVEHNYLLNLQMAKAIQKEVKRIEPFIKPFLEKHDQSIDQILLVGKLKSQRLEINCQDYLVVLDKNYYGNIEDYNIEVEAKNKKDAEHFLQQILKKFNIEYQKDYKSKSARAIGL